MRGEYQVGWKPDTRFDQRAAHFAFSGTVILVLLAAIPAALGLLQQKAFDFLPAAAAVGGQNAAATAFALGNQPRKPALARDAGSIQGAKEGVLALCSGTSGTRSGARLRCTTLASTIQR